MATNIRIGISTNLPDGATYDLLLIDHPDSYPEGKIEFKFNETPRKITGIQKVAQYYLKTLLTRKGSDVINENLGTYFTDYTINANRTSGDREFYTALMAQIRDAESQTKSILNTVGSDDASMLQDVGILGIDIATEAAVIYLKITTQAGISAQVAVPFPELDMKLSEE
jgi:hypothetical protein